MQKINYMVFSELTNNNTVTIYTKNEVNTYFVKQIESNDISTKYCSISSFIIVIHNLDSVLNIY